MYGVVVMMALSTGAETPDFGHRNSCHGCRGGYYASCGGCYGGWYSGCYGGCRGWRGGCYGGGCYGATYYRSYGCGGYGYGAAMPRADVYYPGTRVISEAPYTETPRAAAPADASAATISVRMPSAGRLMIDDYAVPYDVDSHTYVTGPIAANSTRTITFRTNVMKDGRLEPVTRQLTVKPGQKATLDFAGTLPPRQ